MLDISLAELVSQLSPFTIGVCMVVWAMRFAKGAQKDANEIVKDEKSKNSELQETVLNVLNNQMTAESKRDEREVEQLAETKRSNLVMEDNLKTMTELIDRIAMDNIEIKTVVGNIYANSEAIKSGVDAMNASDREDQFDKIIDLLEQMNSKLDAVLPPVPDTLPEDAPEPKPESDPTKPVPPPQLNKPDMTLLAGSHKTTLPPAKPE